MEKKLSLIKENKDAAVAAINSYLDKVYDLTDKYFNEDLSLKEGLTPDEKVEKFIRELRSDCVKYESVRQKLINSDFNLSLYEINLIGLSFMYVAEIWKQQIEMLTKAKSEAENIVQSLLAKKES
jgi:hypothetical protein